MFKWMVTVFKWVRDLFKKNEPPKETKQVFIIPPSEPKKKIPEKIKRNWIDRLVRWAKSKKERKLINEGTHIARPKHPIKPLRRIRPTAFFYSSNSD